MRAPRGDRVLAALALLAGAGGVILSAAAAHGEGGGSLDTAARFLLIHGGVILAVMSAMRSGLLHAGLGRVAGWVLLAGLLLFSGDLSVRAIYGIAPWRMAAPTGGTLLIAGWCLAALAAVLPSRQG